MSAASTFDDTRDSIQNDIDHFGGQLPERYALVWDGYIAALVIHDLITIAEHARLAAMLPKIENNPVITVLLGRPNDYSD